MIKIYFPNRRLRKCSVSFCDEMAVGTGNPKTKLVRINKSYKHGKGSCGTSLSEDELNSLLLHELCHLVAGLRGREHGVRWQREFERCLNIAQDRGFEGIEDKIEVDLRWYQEKNEE